MPKVAMGALVAVVLAVLVLAAATLGIVWTEQRRLTYFPDRSDPGSAVARFARGSDVVLHTADGLDLRAWRFDPADANGWAVVYLPGNSGNRLGRTSIAEALTVRGFTVLLVDYRGFGGNPGSPSEQGLNADALAAVELLLASGFTQDKLIYVGESIGTGVATTLAVERPPAALLLRSPYTSLGDVVRDLVKIHPGILMGDHFDTLGRIGQVTAPVTVLAGSLDRLVRPAQSEAVALGAQKLHAYVLVPDADHNAACWFDDFIAAQVSDLVGSG